MKSFYSNRPKSTVVLNNWDKAKIIVNYLLFFSLLAMIMWLYPKLPETIPIHFDFNGNPNGFGSKSSLFILPGIYLLVTIIMTVVQKYPEISNIPVKITEENAQKQYKLIVDLLINMRVVIGMIFNVLAYKLYIMQSHALDALVLVFSIGSILGTIAIYLVKAFSLKN